MLDWAPKTGSEYQRTWEWARGLVNEVLQGVGMGADGRWRNVLPVARGIVDLIAGEIQTYRRQRGKALGA